MRAHPLVTSLPIVLGAVVLAFGLAVTAERGLGQGPVVAAGVTAAVVVALFAWRIAEGLTTFAVVVLLSDTVEYWSGADLRFIDEAAVPLLVAAALIVHRRRLTLPRPGLRETALAVVFAAGIASSLVNAVPWNIWLPALGLLGKSFVFFYLVLSVRMASGDLRRISGVILVVGLVIAAVGLVEFVAPQVARDVLRLPPVDQQRGAIDVVSSVFTHPALYGWITVFLSLFLLARFAVVRAWWALALALVLGAAAILSARRTPVLGLGAGIVVGVLRQVTAGRGATARILAPAALLVVLIVGISVPLLGEFYRSTLDRYIEPPERVAEVFSPSPSAEKLRGMTARNALYLGSLAIARDHAPLGGGLGRFGSHMSRERYSPLYREYGLDRVYLLRERNPRAVTDTYWPMILGETGVIGFAGMATFIGIVGRQLWTAAGRTRDSTVRAFVFGGLLVFADSLVRSVTSAVYVAPPIAYFVLGAAALALAASAAPDQALREEQGA